MNRNLHVLGFWIVGWETFIKLQETNAPLVQFIVFPFEFITLDNHDFPVAFGVFNVYFNRVCGRKSQMCEGTMMRRNKGGTNNLREFIDVAWSISTMENVLNDSLIAATGSAAGGEVVVIVLPTSDLLLLDLFASGGLLLDWGVFGVAFGLGDS